MLDTPPECESSPSGEPVAKVDTGEPTQPGTGEPPPITPTPEVKVTPTPAPAADSHDAPTLPDDDGSGTVRIGEVFDLGERGRYTVKECLGRGGMGEVYRAECVAPDAKEDVQVFALKVLRPDALPRHARTFVDEVHLLSLLRHEHIARYHDFFVDKGRQVLVMQYVEGRSLHAILNLARRKGRTLSEPTSLELLAQVADALGYAHAAKDEDGCPLNIVHRDVSPSNIMVNSAGCAVLMDFGVAKADLKDRTQTRSGDINIRGKLPYLSPEQVVGHTLDGRSDIFSVGSVLVEMLTGEPPFGRAAKLGTLVSTATVTPEYVDAVTRGLSEKVRAICQKALACHPDQRFADAGEMAAAMLANLPCRGPEAVKEEIAELEALPDAPSKTPSEAPPVPGRRPLPDAPAKRVESLEADLLRVLWNRRALKATAALAFTIAAGFFLWSAYFSRPTAAPHEQPMPPTVKAEEGKTTVNNEMKPDAATPEVAEAAPVVSPPAAAVNSRTIAALASALLCALTPGCVHIRTGAQAGDCYHEVKRELDGTRVPDVMYVGLDESNPKGPCTGRWSQTHITRDEPCPVYDKGPIFMRQTGDTDEEALWYAPTGRNPERDIDRPSLLIGTTKIIDATGKYDSAFGHPPRGLTQRMTVLVTEIRRYDGKKVPVCGVLYGNDDREGVPVFSSPYYDKPTGGEWGNARVKFFWPKQ